MEGRKLDRRKFIKLAGSALVLGLFSADIISKRIVKAVGKKERGITPITDVYDPRLVEQNTRMPTVSSKPRWGLVIDIGACIGCRRCAYACKLENNISEKIYPLWIEVFESDADTPLNDFSRGNWTTKYTESPRPGKRYMPVQCMHCDNPPCAKVCPVGARYKSEDGIVDTRYERCIGCRYCVVACPYNANRFNWYEPEFHPGRKLNPEVPVRPVGVVEKCTFCSHRVRKGLYPRCVEVCPVKARRFGDLNDPESEVSKILRSWPTFRLLEEQGTEPSIFYATRGVKWGPNGEKL